MSVALSLQSSRYRMSLIFCYLPFFWFQVSLGSLTQDSDPQPKLSKSKQYLLPVLRIRIHRIHMFLGLPDPDPLEVVIRILLWIRILLSSCKTRKKNLDSYYFVTLFYFLSLKNDVNVPSKSNKQIKLC